MNKIWTSNPIRVSQNPRRAIASAAAAMLLATTAGVSALADENPQARTTLLTQGRHIPTDEIVSQKHLPRIKPRRIAARNPGAAQNTTESVWLFDYVARLLDAEPAAAQRPRASAAKQPAAAKRIASTIAQPLPLRPSIASPVNHSPAATEPAAVITARPTLLPPANAKPIAPVAPPPNASVTTPATAPAPASTQVSIPHIIRPVEAAPLPAVRPDTPIITGALPTLPMERLPQARIVTPDASEALVIAAERAQARADLVKLEFASRTYNERRLSGQSVFDLRLDWKVLERAQDALSESEVSAALAAGFQANAYVNDATKTIVIAVAGSEDLRRDFLQADLWDALIRAQMPQQFFLAKTYTRSVMQRYQSKGYSTECVGHSLGGGACAYVAAELGVRAVVVNPISAGRLPPAARHLVTNYVVDGEIATLVYGARGNQISGDIQRVSDGRDEARARAFDKYGPLAGPILVIRTLSDMVKGHKVERALDLIAAHADAERPR